MEQLSIKSDVIKQLQKEVLSLQSLKGTSGNQYIRLAPIHTAFHDQTFPIGAIHEFISNTPENAAATNGFITGLLGQLTQQKKNCLWVGTKRTILPSALQQYGISPERIIFIDLNKQKDALWTIEEALKCDSLAAVIGEVSELGFKESRRLQLTVEQSNVTGFIHRYKPRSENTTACVTRWKISPIASALEDGMPGVGFPRWNVQLLKVRNGKPGSWDIEWSAGGFQHIVKQQFILPQTPKRKTG